MIEEFRKKLVDNPTQAEIKFKKYLLENNINFEFQKIIKPKDNYYIADFYLKDTNTVIELDGRYHSTPEQMEKDELRTKELESLGIKVIRIPNKNIIKNNFKQFIPNTQIHLNNDNKLFRQKKNSKKKKNIDNTRIQYGKYKGKQWKYLKKDNKNYLIWLYDNDYKLPNDIKEYIKK